MQEFFNQSLSFRDNKNLNLMGSWGYGSFGNDGAGDWVCELLRNPSFVFIRKTLQASLDNPNDSWTNEQSIAAAETLCVLNGKVPPDYHEVSHNLEPAIEILKKQPRPTNLNEFALKVVEQIEKESELKELWEGMEEWAEEINNLKKRLTN